MVDELSQLVAQRIKTATCSMLWQNEAEGDRSLSFWRDAHWRFFSRACASLDHEPAADMPLVCERFRVIYKPS
jgi:uncharacterized protein YhfF